MTNSFLRRRPQRAALAAALLALPLLALPARATDAAADTQPGKAQTNKPAQKAASKPARRAPKPAKAAAPKPAAKPAAKPATKPVTKPAAKPAAAKPAAPAASAAPEPARPAAAQQADFIVAVVNDEPVTNNELRGRMARAERQLRSRGGAAPGEAELRREMLERLIAERAQLQYAKETGLEVDEGALKQAELSIARQNQLPDVAALHRQLAQEGIAVKDFQNSVREQVLLARLREREIEPRVRVTDKEVDAYIQEQTGQKATPQQALNLAMILVAVPENASAEETALLQKRAEEVARRARSGEDFASFPTPTTGAATAACSACAMKTATPPCSWTACAAPA